MIITMIMSVLKRREATRLLTTNSCESSVDNRDGGTAGRNVATTQLPFIMSPHIISTACFRNTVSILFTSSSL